VGYFLFFSSVILIVLLFLLNNEKKKLDKPSEWMVKKRVKNETQDNLEHLSYFVLLEKISKR
jgi:hypothetical protein